MIFTNLSQFPVKNCSTKQNKKKQGKNRRKQHVTMILEYLLLFLEFESDKMQFNLCALRWNFV